tara:strand:- start:614 stop:1024 length:411 start_codon:yes stop_codon:yes gene_type:complete
MAEENKSDDSKQIEFKDFKKSVTRGEFAAILAMAISEYDKMKNLVDRANEFNDKAGSQLIDMKGDEGFGSGMPMDLVDKLVDGLKRKAYNQASKMFSDELNRMTEVTDFINRFQESGKERPYLSFNYLNKNNEQEG